MSTLTREVLLKLGGTGRKTLPTPVILRTLTFAQLLLAVDRSTFVNHYGLLDGWKQHLAVLGDTPVYSLYKALYLGISSEWSTATEFAHTYPELDLSVQNAVVPLPLPLWDTAIVIGLALYDSPALCTTLWNRSKQRNYVRECVESMAFQRSCFETV